MMSISHIFTLFHKRDYRAIGGETFLWVTVKPDRSG